MVHYRVIGYTMVIHCDLLHRQLYTMQLDISNLPCFTVEVRQYCQHTERIAYYLFTFWWIMRHFAKTIVNYTQKTIKIISIFFLRLGSWKYLYFLSYQWHSNFMKLLTMKLSFFKQAHLVPNILYTATKAVIEIINSGHYIYQAV